MLFFTGFQLVLLFLQADNNIQALVCQHRERAAAIHCHRRQDREQYLIKIRIDMGFLLFGQLCGSDKPDAGLFQLRQNRTVQAGILTFDKVANFTVEKRQQLFRRHAGR